MTLAGSFIRKAGGFLGSVLTKATGNGMIQTPKDAEAKAATIEREKTNIIMMVVGGAVGLLLVLVVIFKK